MPSLRHCSVGPPRRAIHGPARLSRHPCRDAHCAMPAFGQRGLTGRPRSRSRARAGHIPASMWLSHRYREQARSHIGSSSDTKSMCTAKPVGASLLAMRPAHPTSPQTDTPPSRASPLPQEKRGPTKSQVGYKAASRWTLISGAPLTTLAERRHCAVGNPAWMPG